MRKIKFIKKNIKGNKKAEHVSLKTGRLHVHRIEEIKKKKISEIKVEKKKKNRRKD